MKIRSILAFVLMNLVAGGAFASTLATVNLDNNTPANLPNGQERLNTPFEILRTPAVCQSNAESNVFPHNSSKLYNCNLPKNFNPNLKQNQFAFWEYYYINKNVTPLLVEFICKVPDTKGEHNVKIFHAGSGFDSQDCETLPRNVFK